MLDARHFEATERLRNGLTVTIRAIRPDDKAGVVAAFAQLAPESIYTRLFRVKTSLSHDELVAATEVDFESVVALVVTIERGGEEIIVGGGRYLAFAAPGGRSAEIAFVVEEDYQRLGIATRVLKHLALIARERGVGQFEADVLPHNQAMLAVFSRSGLPMRVAPRDDLIHVTLSLTASAATEKKA